jgi:1,2-diacylglycerol 3-alpha-glucosyltransferase
VGFFTECYRPIVNGIVASIDAARVGLRAAGAEVTTIAPSFPNTRDERDEEIVRLPSLPLPTSTGYRLCLPYVRARDRERMRNFAIVHAHSPFITGWMAAQYARRHNVPFVFTYHTRLEAYAHYVPIASPQVRERAAIALTRRYANAADLVLVPTLAMQAQLEAFGVRARIVVVPSAIDVARFAHGRRVAAVRERLGAQGDAPLVLAVARLGREKNLELAIAALADRAGAGLRLAIVGEGAHRAALEALARSAGVADRIRFAGALPPADLPDVYASADAFVFPSTTETQGLVLAEALAAGLQVVAVDVPASHDVLGGAGVLVPAEAGRLAAALAVAVTRGRNESAVHLAHMRFSMGGQSRTILGLYEEAIAAKTP